MRCWIVLAARLYPRAWRERYGDEFDALVEDAAADWRQLLNVTRSAISMQALLHLKELRLAGGLMLAGALLAMAASYGVPKRYVSSAVLQMAPVLVASQTTIPSVYPAGQDMLQRITADRIFQLRMQATGRDSMLRLLQQPGLDLYPVEREHEGLEDLAEYVLAGDIHVIPVSLPDGKNGLFRISVAYPDRVKAQAVVREMVAQIQRNNDATNRESAAAWSTLWSEPIPFSERVDVVQPASLPSSLDQPRRTIFAAIGTAAGLLLGILTILFRRRPQLGLRIAACGLAGCAVAGGISLFITEKYTASAVLRLTAPFTPKQLSGDVAVTSVGDYMRALRDQVLSADNISQIVSKLKLDPEGMTAILKGRDRVFHLSMSDPGSEGSAVPSFEISVSHPDRILARNLAVALISEFQTHYHAGLAAMDEHADEQVRIAHQHRAGENLMIVTQPRLEDEPVTHYRMQLTMAGVLMGMLLAVARWGASGYRTSINGESSLSL